MVRYSKSFFNNVVILEYFYKIKQELGVENYMIDDLRYSEL